MPTLYQLKTMQLTPHIQPVRALHFVHTGLLSQSRFNHLKWSEKSEWVEPQVCLNLSFSHRSFIHIYYLNANHDV